MINIIITINDINKLNNEIGDLSYCFIDNKANVYDLLIENINQNKNNANKLNVLVKDNFKIQKIISLDEAIDQKVIYYLENYKDNLEKLYKLQGNIYIILLKDCNQEIKKLAFNNPVSNDPILNKILPENKHFCFKNGEKIENFNEKILLKVYYKKNIKSVDDNTLGNIGSKIELLENHIRGFYYDSCVFSKYGS